MKKNGLKSIIIVVFCACLCVGYFYYLTQKTGGKEASMKEAEMIISKDLENSYPKTAREVVKFYNRILKCYYSRGYTEDQLTQIAQQARILMDEELREKNPLDSYLLAVKEDIASFAKDGKEMYNTSVESRNEMEFKEIKGRECAYADVDYYIKSKKGSQRTSQTFILRRDAENKWRILGFYQ